ncbi:uncharacterized protein LOC126776603 [Nymphalis io]|uniref:uncharacterized protein LOC126776603 n=1 Tax=Inachis io TaxID=171585 RepID=UPI0021698EC6|nr:uncharacterized protein LOC126776603 [Nymphalis io]
MIYQIMVLVGNIIVRPPRPRPYIASDALSAVTDALTSIALYDDQQCVPRLLCEAAGGGALGSSGIIQTLSGLQPLLTLLSAYNGISTNPLFVFGRAIFLGMSSNGNTASCRYAYPLCPTDPEQLVYYLNNHNGGFFRFFNSPQQGQQNVEQFYNQLSQNYGHQQGQPQNYGLYNPNPAQNYDRDIDKIQRRIQNKPISHEYDNSEDFNMKWKFPEALENNSEYYENESEIQGYDRKIRGFTFPESNSNTHYKYYNYVKSNEAYNDKFIHNNQYYGNKYVYHGNDNEDDLRGIRTVYIVRGNGDPNNPEIIKLRPGETIQ